MSVSIVYIFRTFPQHLTSAKFKLRDGHGKWSTGNVMLLFRKYVNIVLEIQCIRRSSRHYDYRMRIQCCGLVAEVVNLQVSAN